MNLKGYHDKILKPTLIRHIKLGKVDNALADPDCLEIILADPELTEALKYRINEMENKE